LYVARELAGVLPPLATNGSAVAHNPEGNSELYLEVCERVSVR
jgi:hypothetical protein